MAQSGKKLRRENLVALKMAVEALVKAGDDSLRAAYNLGQIIDALYATGYTYETMGDAVDRSPSTVAKYRRLFGMYAKVEDLLRTAHKYETFDVSILTGSQEKLAAKFGYKCDDCGSWNTHRTRKTELTVVEGAGNGRAKRAASRPPMPQFRS